jgi:acyl-CoA dehydrogenase
VISFEPTEEQDLVRATVRDFAVNALRGAARDADEHSALPEGFLAEAWSLGLTASQIPEAYGGGAARSPLTNTLVLEELGYGDPALAAAAAAPSLFATAIVDAGTEEQRRRFLPLFCGDAFHPASLAIVEPRPAFDPTALETTAVRGADCFRLTGRKSFVPLGETASHFLVTAKRADAAPGSFAGLDAFIVARDAAGLGIRGPEPNLGLRALPTATLDLDGVEVPAADRIGGERGCDVGRIVASSRVGLAALQVGLARAVLDYVLPYAKERVAFGEAIAQKQAIAFMLADMAIEVVAMRWLVWKAASRLERGEDATREAHLARSYVATQTMKIADNGIQVLGGHGFIREHPVELWYRHARTLSVLEGVAAV